MAELAGSFADAAELFGRREAAIAYRHGRQPNAVYFRSGTRRSAGFSSRKQWNSGESHYLLMRLVSIVWPRVLVAFAIVDAATSIVRPTVR